MSGREIYTYENLADLKDSRMFEKIRRFPQITVSADLRKSLKGTYAADRMEGLFPKIQKYARRILAGWHRKLIRTGVPARAGFMG